MRVSARVQFVERLHRERRAGFTLIELLIALVLIQIGLLALVTTNAVLVRQLSTIRARAVAVSAASNRLQLLGATPCVGATGSYDGAAGLVEHWSVELQPNATREIRDSVRFAALGTMHFLVLRTRLPC